jgi:hypothetical protein
MMGSKLCVFLPREKSKTGGLWMKRIVGICFVELAVTSKHNIYICMCV